MISIIETVVGGWFFLHITTVKYVEFVAAFFCNWKYSSSCSHNFYFFLYTLLSFFFFKLEFFYKLIIIIMKFKLYEVLLIKNSIQKILIIHSIHVIQWKKYRSKFKVIFIEIQNDKLNTIHIYYVVKFILLFHSFTCVYFIF